MAWSDAAQQLTPKELLSLLDRLQLHPSTTSEEERLLPLRSQIDELDRELLTLLARRMALSREIGQVKAAAHLPIVQPERYRSLLDSRLAQGGTLGLDEGFLRELFSSIHEASVHCQHIELP